MVNETGKGTGGSWSKKPSPLLDRIRQREHKFSAGISVLLGLPEQPSDSQAAAVEVLEVPAGLQEPAATPPEAQAQDEEPSRLNRGALLSRLQGTHQANLNRGFYALLNSAVPTAQVVAPPDEAGLASYRVRMLPLAAIVPNPYLPVGSSDPQAMELLVQSIREQGIIEPLQVHPAPGQLDGEVTTYWIIAGERRRQAALAAGMRDVPAIVKDVAPRAGLQMFLSDSIHTYRLAILDHAQIYRVLTDEMGMTPHQIASRIGAPLPDVEAEIAFLQMDTDVQQSLREGRLSSGQARVLLDAPDDESRRVLWEYAMHYRPAPERMRHRLQRMLEGDAGGRACATC